MTEFRETVKETEILQILYQRVLSEFKSKVAVKNSGIWET